MRLRFTGPALAMSLLIFGCASSAPQSASSDRIWQAQLLRQQQAVRDQGRIGYIGYEGPSSSYHRELWLILLRSASYGGQVVDS